MKQITFGERLKDLRTEQNLGQVELAKLTKVSKSIISSWENNEHEPKLSSLIAIADYFHVTLDYLVGRED